MTWTYRPPVVWTLIGQGNDADIDLTPFVLAWDVSYGTSYDDGSGEWALQSAAGSLTLDNAGAVFDIQAGNPAAIVTPERVSYPQPVQCTLGDGDDAVTLWQGVAVLRASLPLRPADTVRWSLRGRHWQLLRSLIEWRQTDNSATGVTPAEVVRRVLRDAAGLTGSDPSADLVSPASVYPDGVGLRDVSLSETGGQAWNRLAHALASIPFEDAYGNLGVTAVQHTGNGRQFAVPVGLRPLDDSRLETAGTMSLWGIDVISKNYTAGTAETLITLDAAGFTRKAIARYDYPDDVLSVEWGTPQPTAAAGWSVIHFKAYPAPDGTRADIVQCVLRKDNAQAQPSGVRFVGTKLAEQDAPIINPIDGTIAVDSAASTHLRRQTTPPWIDPTVNGFSLDAHTAAVAFLNEMKVHGRVRYPLWAQHVAEALPAHVSSRTGMLVPGSVSRYVLGDGEYVDLITGTVTLAGGSDQVPTATIEGWTYSGAGTDDDPILTGLPTIPDIPGVWEPTIYPTPELSPEGRPPIPVTRGGLFTLNRLRNPAWVAEVSLDTGRVSAVADTVQAGTNPSEITGAGGKLYVIESGVSPAQIAEVSLDNGNLRRLGATGLSAGQPMTQIGSLGDALYVIAIDESYDVGRVSLDTGSVTVLGSSGSSNMHSPTGLGGKLYAVDYGVSPAQVAEVSLSNGSLRRLGTTGVSSIAYLAAMNGRLFTIVSDQLGEVSLDTGRVTLLGSPGDIAGASFLASLNGKLYTYLTISGSPQVAEVSPLNGSARPLGPSTWRSGLHGLAAVSTPAPPNPPRLTRLAVTDVTLRPTFHPQYGAYEVFIPTAAAGSFRVIADAAAGATVTGDGDVTYKAGETFTHTVQVTDSEGNAVDYTITILRT